jgi:hypothetical protein
MSVRILKILLEVTMYIRVPDPGEISRIRIKVTVPLLSTKKKESQVHRYKNQVKTRGPKI